MKNRKVSFLLVIFFISSYFSSAQLKFNETDSRLPNPTGNYILKTVKLSTGVKLQYAEQGDAGGDPVIFLHGYTDSWHSFEQVFAHLPLSIHAYALSQRGHGNSDKPEKGYDPADFAADVAAFMKKLKIESAIIVGHSLGATIAQRFALDYPDLSNALVLIGALASFKDKPGLLEFSDAVNQLQEPVDSAFVYEFQKSTLAKDIPTSDLNTYVNESRKLPARVWKATMKGMMSIDYQTELKKIEVPTLIIWGDKDLIAPESDQDKLQSRIKHSTLIIYEGTGHGVHWEAPGRFTNDLLSFINKFL